MSGSIAVPKAIVLLKMLLDDNFIVRVACTDSTFNFIDKSEVESLTGFPVIHKNFQNKLDMEHINLGRWADLCLLCPATANTINHLSYGSGDNIVGTLFLAYELGKKPFVIAPAMNTQMYHNPATRDSIIKLKNWGLDVLPTNFGELACGEVGEGRLLEPDFIFSYIKNRYFNGEPKKKILITAGATKESIDGVRFITNFSTGRTGAKIADQLTLLGCDVTLVKATSASLPKYTSNIINFTDFNSLNQTLKNELSSSSHDAVIMTAAISDFSVDKLVLNEQEVKPDTDLKISSTDDLSIKLKKNFKIINNLNSYSKNKNLKIIAFKLTKTKDQKTQINAVDKILSNPDIHMVIHNDLNDIESNNHKFNIFSRNSENLPRLDLQAATNTIYDSIQINLNQNKIKETQV